jgi:hypothetical protein
MLNVQTAESIISLITFLIAYGVSVTVAGCFTAWVALKMGDETPADEGFLTLNPFAHIDLLGTVFLILYNFGWGKFIPINPFNMHGRFKLVKVITAFSAKSLAHLGLALFSLLGLLGLFGEGVLCKALPEAHPQSSSYIISIGMILISMLVVNMVLAVITFFVNMCGMAIMFVVEKNPQYLLYTSLIMVIVPVVLFYLFGNAVLMITFGLLQKIGYLLATFLHLC